MLESVKKTGCLLVAEDCVASGSVGQRLAAAVGEAGMAARICLINSGRDFVTHGSLPNLKRELGLDGEGIAKKAKEVLDRG